jgi:hypothetical protein
LKGRREAAGRYVTYGLKISEVKKCF